VSWLQLVQAISTDVVARLAYYGMPPLVDGAILMGPEHEAEWGSAPRIVMVPIGSEFSARRDTPRRNTTGVLAPGAPLLYIAMLQPGSGYTHAMIAISAPTGDVKPVQATANAIVGATGSIAGVQLTAIGNGYLSAPTVTITGDGTGAQAVAALGPSQEQLAEMSARALWSEAKRFRVEVWGVTYTSGSPTPTPDADWDATETLYHVMIQSMQALFGQGGGYRIEGGHWVSSDPEAPKDDVFGRWYRFCVTFGTPVTDTALEFVPVGTMGDATLQLQDQTGSPEPP
jgi:hypothetical protein